VRDRARWRGDSHPGFAVGVAKSNSPTGPFRDARGSALITNDMTKQTPNDWFPETICYAMSDSIHGPWEYQGILNEIAGNTETNHQSIIEFKGKSCFICHTGAVPPRDGEPGGGRFRRSVSIDRLFYIDGGTLRRVIMTTEGIE
jgi:hypothetical protein